MISSCNARYLALVGQAAAVLLGAASTSRADFLQMSGDLKAFLNLVDIPGSGSEAFIPPSLSDRNEFGDAVAVLVQRNFMLAAALADQQKYDLIEFTHTGNGQPYYVLLERPRPEFRGLGTYVFNPAWRRLLNIQAPHPLADTDTGEESIDMFMDLDAAFLQIAGTHRCANIAFSTCAGNTTICNEPSSGPHHESDAAHNTLNFFQVASDRVAAVFPTLTSLQIHGFPLCVATVEQEPVAHISNGACQSCQGLVCDQVPGSLCTQIALAINGELSSAGYSGFGALSWNAVPTDPSEVQLPADPMALCNHPCGNTSTQGRSLNGAADPCSQLVVTVAPRPERFVHIEQQRILRRAPGNYSEAPGVSRQIMIDAIENAFYSSPQFWVDFNHVGSEDGSFAQPWNTLNEGVQHAPHGATVRIRTGASSETILIGTPLTIRGFDGSVVIGP